MGIVHPLFTRVVLKAAWLDGHAGLTYAALSAHAAWLRAVKLRQIEQQKRSVVDSYVEKPTQTSTIESRN
jgi:hypothetical protein